MMSAKQRILALRLLDKQKKHPEFMKTLGVEVNVEDRGIAKTILKEKNKWKKELKKF
ncbi:MAG: hypothetical protein IJB84_01005 [Lachnospiraceae bacterium]|nr:hypothetical protein [Lachnospiraceae bacterium]